MKSEYIDVEYVEVIEEDSMLTKEYLQENPSIIGEEIAKLAKSIEDSKSDIEKIKSRNLWKRLTTNNTKDLADVMLKQNETTTAFLTIVQGIILLSMNNIEVLAQIMDAIEKKEEEDFIRDNQHTSMAKDYLIEAIKSAKKIQNNEYGINEAKEKLKRQAITIENLKEVQQKNLDQIDTLENKVYDINKSIRIKSYVFVALIVILILIKI